jgi:hypothetical protein
MVPPFLAYHGVAAAEISYMQAALLQIELYNEVLEGPISLPNKPKCRGLWRHIESQPSLLPSDVCCTDPYIWLTR